MTREEIRRLVDAIDPTDPEYAHAYERKIWRMVLKSVAHGTDDPQGLAREALRTLEIKFPRWFA